MTKIKIGSVIDRSKGGLYTPDIPAIKYPNPPCSTTLITRILSNAVIASGVQDIFQKEAQSSYNWNRGIIVVIMILSWATTLKLIVAFFQPWPWALELLVAIVSLISSFATFFALDQRYKQTSDISKACKIVNIKFETLIYNIIERIIDKYNDKNDACWIEFNGIDIEAKYADLMTSEKSREVFKKANENVKTTFAVLFT